MRLLVEQRQSSEATLSMSRPDVRRNLLPRQPQAEGASGRVSIFDPTAQLRQPRFGA
jgi:hypothetical protein